MNFRYCLLIFFAFALSNAAIAQTKANDTLPEPESKTAKEKGSFTVFPSVGYVLQKNSFAEVNLIAGDVVCEGLMCGFMGWRVGVESNLQNGPDQIIAPKIGFEAASQILALRFSAVDYLKDGQSEFRLLPEIGLTVSGLLDITYGYGFRIAGDNIAGIGGHRLGIAINISPKLFKEVF